MSLTAEGGLCASIPQAYQLHSEDDIWDNGVAPLWRNRTFRGRLRNFFAWSPDWGTYMRGGPLNIRIRDLLVPLPVSRGGIRFHRPPEIP